jgi:hypothetical protein
MSRACLGKNNIWNSSCIRSAPAERSAFSFLVSFIMDEKRRINGYNESSVYLTVRLKPVKLAGIYYRNLDG